MHDPVLASTDSTVNPLGIGRLSAACVIVAGPVSDRAVTYRTGSPAVTGSGALDRETVAAGGPAPALSAVDADATAAIISTRSAMRSRPRRTQEDYTARGNRQTGAAGEVALADTTHRCRVPEVCSDAGGANDDLCGLRERERVRVHYQIVLCRLLITDAVEPR